MGARWGGRLVGGQLAGPWLIGAWCAVVGCAPAPSGGDRTAENLAGWTQGFGGLDNNTIWIASASLVAGTTYAIVTWDPTVSPPLYSNYSALATSGNNGAIVVLRPRTPAEIHAMTGAGGLDVSVGGLATLGVLRGVVRSSTHTDANQHLILQLFMNPNSRFQSPSYALRVTPLPNGSKHFWINRVAVNGTILSCDLTATLDSTDMNAFLSDGLDVEVQNANGDFIGGSYLAMAGEVGLNDNFYRGTQIGQGALPILGQGLIQIPDYLLASKSKIDIGYPQKQGFAKELPFTDFFTIQFSMGGFSAGTVSSLMASLKNMQRSKLQDEVLGLYDPVEPQHSLDYAVLPNDPPTGYFQFRDVLIEARVWPYLEQGYQLGDITLNLNAIPWDMAGVVNQGGFAANCNPVPPPDPPLPNGVHGGCSPDGTTSTMQIQPPADFDQWEHAVAQMAQGLIAAYPGRGAPRFQVLDEGDSTHSYNGRYGDFYSLFDATAYAVGHNWQAAAAIPGDFTGTGACRQDSDDCVYNSANFMDYLTQHGRNLPVAVPRSWNVFWAEMGTGALSDAVAKQVAQYQAVGAVNAEYHQYGLDGEIFGNSLPSGAAVHDTGGAKANFELQTMIGLKRAIAPRLQHWSVIDDSGVPDGTGQNLLILNGAGWMRLILDQYQGSELVQLDASKVSGSSSSDVMAVAVIRGQQVQALILSSFERAAGAPPATRIKVTLPTSLANAIGAPSWQYVRSSPWVGDSATSQMRADFQAKGWLSSTFQSGVCQEQLEPAPYPLCVSTPQAMAASGTWKDAMSYIGAHWSGEYLPILQGNLVWRDVADGLSRNGINHSLTYGNRVAQVTLGANELLVLRPAN